MPHFTYGDITIQCGLGVYFRFFNNLRPIKP